MFWRKAKTEELAPAYRGYKQSKEAKLEWPNTTPPEKTDPYWSLNNNLYVNGVSYLKMEIEPGKWQWKVNEEAERRQREYAEKKRKLGMDLQTRVLTEEEMQEVMRYGPSLFIKNMVSYREADKQKQFNEAICQQYRLRAIASSHARTRDCVHKEE